MEIEQLTLAGIREKVLDGKPKYYGFLFETDKKDRVRTNNLVCTITFVRTTQLTIYGYPDKVIEGDVDRYSKFSFRIETTFTNNREAVIK